VNADFRKRQTAQTIITGLAGRPFGLCEKHYNECVKNNFIKIENDGKD
jgi:hypothetical protein